MPYTDRLEPSLMKALKDSELPMWIKSSIDKEDPR
jgi:hypothetical protein